MKTVGGFLVGEKFFENMDDAISEELYKKREALVRKYLGAKMFSDQLSFLKDSKFLRELYDVTYSIDEP